MTKKRKVYNLALVLVLVGLVFVLRWTGRRAVYKPGPHSGAPCPKEVEDVFFASEDGTKLHGWLRKTPGATRSVLMAHGNAGCVDGRKGTMTEVKPAPTDDARRRTLFAGTVLARWVHRCGASCAEVWNRTIGPVVGFEAHAR